MHKLSTISLCLVLLSLSYNSSHAQILDKIKGAIKSERKTEDKKEESFIDTAQWLKQRPTPKIPSYLEYVGSDLSNIWGYMYENDYIPIIYLDAPEKSSAETTPTFSLKEYSVQLAQEERELALAEEEELALEEKRLADIPDTGEFSPLPKEYSIWNNAAIDPYNVNVAESSDTIRINISDYQSPGYKYITSEFGWRRSRMHYGIDLKVYTGDTIKSAFDNGVVRIKRFDRRGYGHYVVVRHQNGLETLYGHMSKILAKKGQVVNTATQIGRVGSTGMSTGPHLHFTVYKNGKTVNPLSLIK